LKIPKGNQNPKIEEEQTTQWPKEKYKRTNNDLQNIHITCSLPYKTSWIIHVIITIVPNIDQDNDNHIVDGQYTVKPVHAVTSIKGIACIKTLPLLRGHLSYKTTFRLSQSLVLKGHIFLLLSWEISYELNLL
jgi:hypothetical protein